MIYYLDDVDAGSHCTSLIPESAETKRQLPKTRDGKSGWGEGALRIADSETAYVDPDKPIWTDSFGRTNPRRIGRVDVHAPAGSACDVQYCQLSLRDCPADAADSAHGAFDVSAARSGILAARTGSRLGECGGV